MTISATGFYRSASGGALAAALIFAASPAAAQRDVTDRDVGAREVALTPLSDLNLARDPIPPILMEAQHNPYANDGIESCADIREAVGDLDAVLGDDFDTTAPEERRLSPGGVAQSVIGMFIPFRGIIREVSGANDHEFAFREAIGAGLMRRAYLKGLGEARDCPYPARPATPEMIARLDASMESATAALETSEVAADGTQFVTRPVVQQID